MYNDIDVTRGSDVVKTHSIPTLFTTVYTKKQRQPSPWAEVQTEEGFSMHSHLFLMSALEPSGLFYTFSIKTLSPFFLALEYFREGADASRDACGLHVDLMPRCEDISALLLLQINNLRHCF